MSRNVILCSHICQTYVNVYVNNVSCVSMYVALYDDYETVYVHIICHYISRAWFAKGPRSTYIAVIGQFLSSHLFHYSVPLIQLGIVLSSSIVISLFLTKLHLSQSLVIIIFVNFDVSAPILTSKLPVYHCHIYCSVQT